MPGHYAHTVSNCKVCSVYTSYSKEIIVVKIGVKVLFTCGKESGLIYTLQ